MSRRYMELANKWLSTPRKKELDLIKKWRILRGDRVAVISGPELGKQGVVSKVFHKENKLIIEGVNLKRVLGEPGPDGQKPRKEWREMGLHYSQVNLIDPVDGLPTRIKIGYLEDGSKVRIAKRSGSIIPRPEILMERRTPRSTVVGEKDTVPEEALRETFAGLDAATGRDPALAAYAEGLRAAALAYRYPVPRNRPRISSMQQKHAHQDG
mmetsp:Transcript_19224/g.33382  ORF Transcript_19224/g.33382 Transcript_19224/m.33382 type:complete len:211 (-) Transcript_19224:514-1146(-)